MSTQLKLTTQCYRCAFYVVRTKKVVKTVTSFNHWGKKLVAKTEGRAWLGGHTPCLMGNGLYDSPEIGDTWDDSLRPLCSGDIQAEDSRMEYRKFLVKDDLVTPRAIPQPEDPAEEAHGYRVVDCRKCLTPCDHLPINCPRMFAGEAGPPRRYSVNIGGDVRPEGFGSSGICGDYVPRSWLSANIIKWPGKFNNAGKLLVLYDVLMRYGRKQEARNLADNLRRTGTLNPDQRATFNQRIKLARRVDELAELLARQLENQAAQYAEYDRYEQGL